MKHYAEIENGIVVNIFVAESDTDLKDIFGDKQIVEYTNDEPAIMGKKYINGHFEQHPVEDSEKIIAEIIAKAKKEGIPLIEPDK